MSKNKEKIAITGRPGIGKSTLCLKVYEKLKNTVKCGGFITCEVRKGKSRVGFKVFDLLTGEEFLLASINANANTKLPKVGKYFVFVDTFNEYIKKLEDIVDELDILIIDEVGPMELKSRNFMKFIEDTINADIRCLFTIHMKSKHSLLRKIRETFKVYTLNESNRDLIAEKVLEELICDLNLK